MSDVGRQELQYFFSGKVCECENVGCQKQDWFLLIGPGKPLSFWSKTYKYSHPWNQRKRRRPTNNDVSGRFVDLLDDEWLCFSKTKQCHSCLVMLGIPPCNAINQMLQWHLRHSQPKSAANIVDWLMNLSMNYLPGVVFLHLRVFLFQVISVYVSLEQGSFLFWVQMVWIECWSLLRWSETTSNEYTYYSLSRKVFNLVYEFMNVHLFCKTF